MSKAAPGATLTCKQPRTWQPNAGEFELNALPQTGDIDHKLARGFLRLRLNFGDVQILDTGQDTGQNTGQDTPYFSNTMHSTRQRRKEHPRNTDAVLSVRHPLAQKISTHKSETAYQDKGKKTFGAHIYRQTPAVSFCTRSTNADVLRSHVSFSLRRLRSICSRPGTAHSMPMFCQQHLGESYTIVVYLPEIVW